MRRGGSSFEWLERALAAEDPGLSPVRFSTLFRPLHSDPRWEKALVRIGVAGQVAPGAAAARPFSFRGAHP